MKLLIASTNEGKIKEFQSLLKPFGIEVIGAHAAGFDVEVEEDQDSFKGNALLKAEHVHKQSQLPVLSDDSGLVLNAFPDLLSVHSARFMADESYENKHEAILKMYESEPDRSAYFETALVLILDKPYFFEGIVKGEIAREPKGDAGFGYDPIFIPEGYDQSFAQLGAVVKDKISHRAKASAALCQFLASRTDE